MNTYSKYVPNVFLAKCSEKHEKGEVIEVTTKYGKENECIVFNLIYERDGFYYYSICLLYTSPSPRDRTRSRMPSSA